MLTYLIIFCTTALVISGLTKDELIGIQRRHDIFIDFKQEMLGGDEAKLKDYPFQAALFLNDSDSYHIGSAVLVDYQWVVTSAQNLLPGDESLTGNSYYISIGSQYPASGTGYTVGKVIVHPLFTGFWTYDIALLKLTDKVKKTDVVDKASLGEGAVYKGDGIEVLGWGGTSSLKMNKIKLDVTAWEECKAHYLNNSNFTTRNFCTYKINAGPCVLDRGGAVVRWSWLPNSKNKTGHEYRFHFWQTPYLIGIYSGADVCGSVVYPPVYTDITILRKWIKDTIANN